MDLYISKQCQHCTQLLILLKENPNLQPYFNVKPIETNPYPESLKVVPTLVKDGQLFTGNSLNEIVNDVYRYDMERNNQQQGGDTSVGSEATTQLIAMLKQQIQQLEEEKKASDAEDEKQNALIAVQAGQLTTQEEKLATQESEIKSLRRSLMNVMNKLGMK